MPRRERRRPSAGLSGIALAVERLPGGDEEKQNDPERDRAAHVACHRLRHKADPAVRGVVVEEADRHLVERGEELQDGARAREGEGPAPLHVLPPHPLEKDHEHGERRENEPERGHRTRREVLRAERLVVPSPPLRDLEVKRRAPDAVPLHLDEVTKGRVAEADRLRLPDERPVDARRTLLDRAFDEPEVRRIDFAHRPDFRLRQLARGRIPRVHGGLFLRQDPADREEPPVRGDSRPIFQFLERTHPSHRPAPHGHRGREDRVRLLEAECPLEIDLRLVVVVEDDERFRAVELESARPERLGPAAHGFLASHLEVDGRLGERPREARAKDRGAREDREQAESDEHAVAPVEAHPREKGRFGHRLSPPVRPRRRARAKPEGATGARPREARDRFRRRSSRRGRSLPAP